MTVNVSKPAINVIEKLSDLDRPTGVAGARMLSAETPQEQFNLINAGRRNMIINGDMRISQRGTSAITAVAGKTYVTDRFAIGRYGSSTAVFTGQQVDTSSDFYEFQKALKCTVTTTDSPSGSEANLITYMFEGHDTTPIGFGTYYAKPITISFWVKSNIPGLYAVTACDNAAAKGYATEYTINTANKWEKKTVTIARFTGAGGTWNYNTTSGSLAISWGLGGAGGRLIAKDQWVSTSGLTPVGTATTTNWVAKTGATFELTGVQMEIGTVATPFEHRSFSEELALCQRYYTMLAAGANYKEEYAGGSSHIIGTMHKWNSSNTFIFTDLPVSMRNSNNMVLRKSGGSSDFSFKSAGYTSTGNDLTLDGDSSNRHLRINSAVTNGSWPSGCSGWVRCNTSSAYCAIDCEL